MNLAQRRVLMYAGHHTPDVPAAVVASVVLSVGETLTEAGAHAVLDEEQHRVKCHKFDPEVARLLYDHLWELYFD